jgi:ferric-dicitrate binding protein FerR (iron transport regulator)
MTRAEIEAAVWVKRLSVTKITVERLQTFWAWRRDPENRRAYDEASRQLDAAREAGEAWNPSHPTLH